MADSTRSADPRGAASSGLRLAVVTETYPPEINGVANTLHQMVAGLGQRGHRLLLIRPGQAQAADPRRAATVREEFTGGLPLPGYPGLQLGLPAGRRIRRLWQQFQPQAAYIATEGPLGRSALAVARTMGVPALTGMHTNFDQYSRHYGVGLLSPLIQHYLRQFHNRSAGTLAPTREMADTLLQHGFRNIHTWPRGVDAELFDPQRRDPALRASWGADAGAPVVLYVGRIAPEKNVDLALQAFHAIQTRLPRARFVVVGDGPARERLQQACPEAVFTGAKVGEELARHYASGDLFLFPSLTETFGNVVLEAMASGLAVLAYDTAAARELIADGANGRVCAPGEATAFVQLAVQLACEPPALAQLGAAARATALAHAWPAIIARLETLFRTLVNPTAEDAANENAA
ncbi:MAG: hypothetical protein RLZ44_306 [Pseudomonadota bacterium]